MSARICAAARSRRSVPERRIRSAASALAQDRAKRLVDLVRDRSRQLTGDGEPRCMREFEALFLHRLLGAMSASVRSTRSAAINAGLQQHDGGRWRSPRFGMPPGTSAPGNARSASAGIAFSSMPQRLHLPPVDVQVRRHDLRQMQRGGRSTGEQLVDDLPRLPPDAFETRHVAADDPDADEGVERAIHRRGGGGGHRPRRIRAA